MDTSKIEKSINKFRDELVQVLKQKDIPNHEYIDIFDLARLKCRLKKLLEDAQKVKDESTNESIRIYFYGKIDTLSEILEEIDLKKFYR